MKNFNLYGDSPAFLTGGHGADIASQRADDLDQMAIELVTQRARSQISTSALDIACGAGGQAIRLAQAGAQVLALDIMDMRSVVNAAARQPGALGDSGKVTFMQFDMRRLDLLRRDKLADVVICQRAIHYLTYSESIHVVSQIGHLLAPDGRLYLSASGIYSELGQGYPSKPGHPGCHVPLENRYSELALAMREKHNILGPVCLYSESDLKQLLINGGLQPESVYSSPFGNIKAVARHVQE